MKVAALVGAAVAGAVVGATLVRSMQPGPLPASSGAVSTLDRGAARDDEIARLRRELEEARATARSAIAAQAPAHAPAAAGTPAVHASDPAVAGRPAEIEEVKAKQARFAAIRGISERVQEEERRATEARRVEDVSRGGTMALLAGLKRDWQPPWDLVSSTERYGKLFERTARGPSLDGASADLWDRPADGSVLQYPAGRFEFATSQMGNWREFPADLVVQGQGMDATLLVLYSSLELKAEVRSLTFRDVTIHANNHHLVQSRAEAMTLRMERCRIVGFDMGAGGSSMLAGSVAALHATDCRIEAGYGGAPGSGNLFDVRGAFLARLERCVVRGPLSSVYYQWTGAAQLFRECQFLDLQESLRSHVENPGGMARFEDCTFAFLEGDYVKPKESKDPVEINPAWVDPEARK